MDSTRETAPADEYAAYIDPMIELAHALGRAPRTYAILGEGNISARLDSATFLVKASGTSLATAAAASFVAVDLRRAMALVREPPMAETALTAALQETLTGDAASMRPSVETGMHAVLIATAGARWVAHTHPAAITGVLCSTNAEALTAGFLFPDQIVVCGAHPMLVPYVDPGIPLAQALQAALDGHLTAYGSPPKAIYLRNHGFVALGQSTGEVLAITDMAVKAATILATALTCGGAHYLPAAEVEHIARRQDEHYRQRMLGLSPSDTGGRKGREAGAPGG